MIEIRANSRNDLQSNFTTDYYYLRYFKTDDTMTINICRWTPDHFVFLYRFDMYDSCCWQKSHDYRIHAFQDTFRFTTYFKLDKDEVNSQIIMEHI